MITMGSAVWGIIKRYMSDREKGDNLIGSRVSKYVS
jgi:hypothetical protein